MESWPRAPVWAAALAAAGCSLSLPTVNVEKVDDIPEAQIARIDAIPEIPQADATRFETIGPVAGVSCRRAYKGTPASWEDAIRRTKYRALQIGGDAIAALSCGKPEGTSMSTFCLESIRCTASALRSLR
ncbi:MAG TPA: hypothetical protein VLV90_13690 [Burkholderiales bacterium]|nr:hypothetical protein [Burkholderiales bacterium]